MWVIQASADDKQTVNSSQSLITEKSFAANKTQREVEHFWSLRNNVESAGYGEDSEGCSGKSHTGCRCRSDISAGDDSAQKAVLWKPTEVCDRARTDGTGQVDFQPLPNVSVVQMPLADER